MLSLIGSMVNVAEEPLKLLYLRPRPSFFSVSKISFISNIVVGILFCNPTSRVANSASARRIAFVFRTRMLLMEPDA